MTIWTAYKNIPAHYDCNTILIRQSAKVATVQGASETNAIKRFPTHSVMHSIEYSWHSIVKFKTYKHMITFFNAWSLSNRRSKHTRSLPLITLRWENDLASADRNKDGYSEILFITNELFLNIQYQNWPFINKETTF